MLCRLSCASSWKCGVLLHSIARQRGGKRAHRALVFNFTIFGFGDFFANRGARVQPAILRSNKLKGRGEASKNVHATPSPLSKARPKKAPSLSLVALLCVHAWRCDVSAFLVWIRNSGIVGLRGRYKQTRLLSRGEKAEKEWGDPRSHTEGGQAPPSASLSVLCRFSPLSLSLSVALSLLLSHGDGANLLWDGIRRACRVHEDRIEEKRSVVRSLAEQEGGARAEERNSKGREGGRREQKRRLLHLRLQRWLSSSFGDASIGRGLTRQKRPARTA